MIAAERIVIGQDEQARACRVAARMHYDQLSLDTGLSRHANVPETAASPAFHAATTCSGKLAELDGLRGVAAVIVVAWHFIFPLINQSAR